MYIHQEKEKDKSGQPDLVSVLTKDGRSLTRAPDGSPVKFKLATDTTVNFLSTHHDIVFAVDVSFSAISSVSFDFTYIQYVSVFIVQVGKGSKCTHVLYVKL